MIKYTVSREDSLYKCFPDLARCEDGRLVLLYRESLFHVRLPFTRLQVQISYDGGMTWTRKKTVASIEDAAVDGGWNNARLVSLGGQRLVMICDWIPGNKAEGTPDTEIWLWRSEDGGETWSEKEDTGIRGHICPSMICLKDGTWIIEGDEGCDAEDLDNWRIHCFRSEDEGKTWSEKILVAHKKGVRLNEGSIVELDDGTLVDYIREDQIAECGYKAISKDGGRTWVGPFKTHMYRCVGRPKAGLLSSGEVAVFYGFNRSPRNLMMYVEPQCFAASPKDYGDLEGNAIWDTAKKYGKGRSAYFLVDHDRSPHPDGAYSGWVNLPNGDVYAVQYITDDAPMAQIRGYRISREDWCLWPPEQSLPGYNWNTAHDAIVGVTDPEKLYAATYREATVEMTRRNLAGE